MTSNSFFTRTFLFLFIVTLLSSCTSSLYYPATQPVPALIKRGQFHSEVTGGIFNGTVITAQSPIKHWGIFASAQKGLRHWQTEGANGFYYFKDNVLYDVYAGSGYLKTDYYGELNNFMSYVKDIRQIYSSGTKFFIQPGIHRFKKKSVFSFTGRLEMISFNEYFFYHYEIDSYQQQNKYKLVDSINDPGRKVFTFTPCVSFRTGKKFSFFTQIGAVIPLSDSYVHLVEQNFLFQPFIFKLGFAFSLKNKPDEIPE